MNSEIHTILSLIPYQQLTRSFIVLSMDKKNASSTLSLKYRFFVLTNPYMKLNPVHICEASVTKIYGHSPKYA